MAPDPKQTQSVKPTPQELWNEIAISRSGIDELLKQGEQTRDLKPVRAALDELQLKTSNYERLLEEMQAPLKAVLGGNFLGTAEWQKGFGVKVSAPPPIPKSITPELLNSKCPLHPGQLIGETHILVLIPKTVDGEPYSALKLDELCSTRKGSRGQLIRNDSGWLNKWKTEPWANLSQAQSEWVLIPRSDPDPTKVPQNKHFRAKNIKQRGEVYKYYWAEYRGARALEVMTMALLNDLVNGESGLIFFDILDRLRCGEPYAYDSRVCVGLLTERGLEVWNDSVDDVDACLGNALVRK